MPDLLEENLPEPILTKDTPEIQKKAMTLPFWQWVTEAHLWVDREYFSYDDFQFLVPIYQSIPNTLEELHGFKMIVMKASQMGGSVIFLMLCYYLMLRFALRIGYYLPDQTTAMDLSGTRFIETIRKNPDLLELMVDYLGHKDEGSKSTRRIANSIIMFLYTGMNVGPPGGKTTMRTESLPLDMLVFDEVQSMARVQMEKTLERASASKLRITGMVSTPVWPDADIHAFFKETTQEYFHTRCRCNSGDGIVISEEFPNSIGERQGEIFYRCPHCDKHFIDPQDGAYVAHNPGADHRGFSFAQTLSRRISVREIWNAYITAKDLQNFWNRKMARPFADPSAVPISDQILKQKVYRDDLDWHRHGGEFYLGLDHMGNLNVVEIKERMPTGKERIVHLEWIEDPDPFKRSAELMKEYRIRIAALEALPNYNEAFRFAKEFPGKVFIVEYGGSNMGGEMLRWRDKDKADPQAVRKTSDEARMEYSVAVDQYKFMSWSLGKIAEGNLEMPDPSRHPLMRNMLVKGQMRPVNIAEKFADHLKHVALKTSLIEDQNKYETKVIKLGPEDPHFAFANMCCDVAIARAYGTTRLLTDEQEQEDQQTKQAKPANPIMEQLTQRVPQIAQPARTETCGACVNYDSRADGISGKCQGFKWSGNTVQKGYIGCDEFDTRIGDYGE